MRTPNYSRLSNGVHIFQMIPLGITAPTWYLCLFTADTYVIYLLCAELLWQK